MTAPATCFLCSVCGEFHQGIDGGGCIGLLPARREAVAPVVAPIASSGGSSAQVAGSPLDAHGGNESRGGGGGDPRRVAPGPAVGGRCDGSGASGAGAVERQVAERGRVLEGRAHLLDVLGDAMRSVGIALIVLWFVWLGVHVAMLAAGDRAAALVGGGR